MKTLILISLCVCFQFSTSSQSTLAQLATNKTAEANPKSTASKPTLDCPDADRLRKNVQQLSGEVQRLRKKVADLEKELLPFTLQEQLQKEEERSEKLQLHLVEIAEKESPLQARMDQINQQLRPEYIERTMAGVGSVHPEDAREELKRRLTGERVRIQVQLDLLRQDRIRTQGSLASTDAAIQRLKQKLAEALRH